jgi:general stress protein 26
MPSATAIEERFWKELAENPVMMIGLDGENDGYAQPMTAQFRDAAGPIWFFASRRSELAGALFRSRRSMAHYVAKGHDLFATIHGALQMETDRARIDEFWVDSMAAWFKGGKADPDLALLRLDPETAKIWLSGLGIEMAIKSLLGGVKAATAGQVARVSLAIKS